MSRAEFDQQMHDLSRFVADKPLDDALAHSLNTHYAPDSAAFRALTRLCRDGIAAGWLCEHDSGGLRWGRVTKPGPQTHDFSVDVVLMRDLVGPHHKHPHGEIDLVMPTVGNARFDGHGAGWVVYAPGSEHSPTVTDGEAMVLYLLPQGAIEFTRAASY